MLFMVIERFPPGGAPAVYAHLAAHGRGLPEGLAFVGSWVEAGLERAFQLMEADDVGLLQEWVLHWRGLAAFEIVPVVPGAETRALVERVAGTG
jgi:hypothetical protein